MKYTKQCCIIFGITMIGELLNYLLPLPIPAGVYGLFLLLVALCSHVIRLEDVEVTGNFLLDFMPMMFVPVAASLLENLDVIKEIAVPLLVICLVSTIVDLTVTGKVTQWIIGLLGTKEKKEEEA